MSRGSVFLSGPGPGHVLSILSDPVLLRHRLCSFKPHMKNRSSEEEEEEEEENNKRSLEADQPNHCLMCDAKRSRRAVRYSGHLEKPLTEIPTGGERKPRFY